MQLLRRLLVVASLAAALGAPLAFADDAPAPENDAARIMQSFEQNAHPDSPSNSADATRRWVMFALGAPLLVLILVTAGLGIAMGIYGKPVYLAHMICAGLVVTLAFVHAIVGIVWFRPF